MEPTQTITPAFRPLFYNPGQLDPAQIESLFIARQELFQNLLADVLAERNDAAPQHHIIIGQRGMGKTTMLHRLAVELNKEPNSERFIPLTFPEEQHVLVERLSDFWLNALDALATALELRKLGDIAQKLDTIIRQLPTQHNDESELANACRREFINQCQALQLRPVLLLDNFPLLLRKLVAHQWDLRSILQAPGAPIFVAAGLALPESLGEYDSAFFDMFKARILYNLTLEECREIYQTMAKREGREEVISIIAKNEGRLKTLHILTGGNPRTVGLLYELFARGLGSDAWEDLRSLLDAMTPIYQSRLEQLSDRGQQIFSALALSWEPVLQQVIESQTQLSQGTISSTLLRLEESGVVEKVDIFGQKKIGWQVAERFFNIWFLMRFASRRTKGSIDALASFLELFYSPDELHGIARCLYAQDMDGERAHYSLAISGAMGNTALSRALCTHTHLQILQLREKLGEEFKDLFEIHVPREVVDFFELRDKILPSLVPSDSGIVPKEFARAVLSSPLWLNKDASFARRTPFTQSQCEELMEILQDTRNQIVELMDETSMQEVENRLYSGILTDTNNEQQWRDAIMSSNNAKTVQFWAELIPPSFLETKELAYRMVIKFNDKISSAWISLGNLLNEYSNRYEEAEVAYRKAIEIDNKDAGPWHNLGNLLADSLHLYKEAEAAYRKAIELNDQFVIPWIGLGNLLMRDKERYDEAEVAYRRAIEIDSENVGALICLGRLLGLHTKRYEEAEEIYNKAIRIDSQNSHVWNDLGNFYFDILREFKQAETCFKKCLEINPDHEWAKLNLVFIIRDYLKKPEEAEALLNEILTEKSILPEVIELHRATFAMMKENLGKAKDCLKAALKTLNGTFKSNSLSDWYRTAAVWLDSGNGKTWLDVWEDTGAARLFMPFFEAVRAHHLGDIRFLNNIPKEVQPTAREIFQEIAHRRRVNEPSTAKSKAKRR
jgi:tetratricopeptide (TPR) repeat protein